MSRLRSDALAAFLVGCLVSACGGSDSSSAPPPWNEPASRLRSSTSLDGTWSFEPEGYPPREVRVPCFWEAIPVWEGVESCPGYLDGTPDEGLDIVEGANWERRTIHGGTYRREIDLLDPRPVTKIWFESIHHQASVFLNDIEIGSHTGPYWKVGFDASTAVRPDANSLRVELTDGTALVGPDGITRWPVGYYALTDITGLYRSVTLESLPAVHVEDAFIVPSVRRRDLTVEHTLSNTLPEPTSVWVTSRAVGRAGEVAFEIPPRRIALPASGKARLVLSEPWPSPVPWTPADPHLYTLKTLVQDSRGEPLDLREDRFGFREVWIEDGHFVLNGMRMNLIGDSVDDQASRPRYWGPQYLSCASARETLERIRALNVNSIRYHQAPPEECLHDLTDELGLLVISESSAYARLDILPPFDRSQEYVENAKLWIDAWVRRQRNHPSIVLWSLENEMFMYGFALALPQIFELRDPAKAADTIERPDGTATLPRPVSWDGDSPYLRLEGYEPETVTWHYPFGRWLTIYPDREWYKDAISHFEPYLFPDTPTGVGETMIVRRTEYPDRTLDQAKAMQGAAVRAMRILGFSDMRPYKLNWAWHLFDPEGREHPWAPYYHSLYSVEQKERLVRNIRESYHPIAAFDREYARTGPNADGTFGPLPLPPSTGVDRSLVVLNDSFLPGKPQTVSWSVEDETSGEPLAGDSFEILVEHGSSEVRKIRFATPAAAEAATRGIVLRVRSRMEGLPQGEFEIEYRFAVGP